MILHQISIFLLALFAKNERGFTCIERFQQNSYIAARDSAWIKKFYQESQGIFVNPRDTSAFYLTEKLIFIHSPCDTGAKPTGLVFKRTSDPTNSMQIKKYCPICEIRTSNSTLMIEIPEAYMKQHLPKSAWKAFKAYNNLFEFPRDSSSNRYMESIFTLEETDPPRCSYYYPPINEPSAISWILGQHYFAIAYRIEEQKRIPPYLRKFAKAYEKRGKDCQLLKLFQKYSSHSKTSSAR